MIIKKSINTFIIFSVIICFYKEKIYLHITDATNSFRKNILSDIKKITEIYIKLNFCMDFGFYQLEEYCNSHLINSHTSCNIVQMLIKTFYIYSSLSIKIKTLDILFMNRQKHITKRFIFIFNIVIILKYLFFK